jgi:hypothetical protein
MRCLACNGKGCDECQNKGTINITDCPLEIITLDVWEIIEMANLYIEHGLPPVAGGQLEQTAGFLDAARFITNEKKHWEEKF